MSCAWVIDVKCIETDVVSMVFVSVVEWMDVNESSESSEL